MAAADCKDGDDSLFDQHAGPSNHFLLHLKDNQGFINTQLILIFHKIVWKSEPQELLM